AQPGHRDCGPRSAERLLFVLWPCPTGAERCPREAASRCNARTWKRDSPSVAAAVRAAEAPLRQGPSRGPARLECSRYNLSGRPLLVLSGVRRVGAVIEGNAESKSRCEPTPVRPDVRPVV